MRANSVALLALAASCGAAAHAEVNSVVFQLEVANASGVATLDVLSTECNWDAATRSVTWNLPDVVLLEDGPGNPIAAVYLASVEVWTTPRAEVRASVGLVAGDSSTTVRAWSPVLSFQPLEASTAGVRSTVTLTASDEDASGFVQMTALGPPGAGSYKGYYAADGSLWKFAESIWRIEAESVPGSNAGQVSASDSVPRNGFNLVSRGVESLYWTSGFTITPGDAVEVSGAVVANSSVEYITCEGDCDRNLMVNLDDLSLVLGSFGGCVGLGGYDWRADTVYDGCVNLDDLLSVLGNFDEACD
jgi:hypothetical protein